MKEVFPAQYTKQKARGWLMPVPRKTYTIISAATSVLFLLRDMPKPGAGDHSMTHAPTRCLSKRPQLFIVDRRLLQALRIRQKRRHRKNPFTRSMPSTIRNCVSNVFSLCLVTTDKISSRTKTLIILPNKYPLSMRKLSGPA